MDLSELAFMLETIGRKTVTVEEFEDSAKKAAGLTLPNEQRLQLYGLYKQATVGDNNTPKPWMIEVVASAKWKAWKEYQGFTQEKARICYWYIVNNLLGETSELSPAEPDGTSSMGTSLPLKVTFFRASTSDPTKNFSESEKIFELIVNNDFPELERFLESHPESVHSISQEGMTPLHYASDRGHLPQVTLLLHRGASPLALDADGNTPLYYAAVCEQTDVFRALIEAGADPSLPNHLGESLVSTKDDLPENIQSLF